MTVSNGQLGNETVFNAAFMSRKVDTSTIGTIQLDGTEQSYYLGDKDTNGSWRITVDAGDLKIEHRETGVWVEKEAPGQGATKLRSYISDAAYESANGAPSGGEIYYNSTTGKARIYDGVSTTWINVGSGVVGYQEFPVGNINGINTDFDISLSPTSDDSIQVFVDGNLQHNDEWSYSHPTITLNTAPNAGQDVYVFYLTEGSPVSITTDAGTNNVVYHTVTPAEETAKAFTLSVAPTEVTKVQFDIVDGVTQEYNVDYTVSGTTVSWSGLGLDGLLAAGDVVRLQYFS